MRLYKYFFPLKTIRGKVLRIENDIKKLVKEFCDEKFWIVCFGAYNIDPKNLVFWICVKTDAEKTKLHSNTDLRNKIMQLFEEYDYPLKARKHIYVGFESQETVNKESNGDWRIHFQ